MPGNVMMTSLPMRRFQAGDASGKGIPILKTRIYMKKKEHIGATVCRTHIELDGSAGSGYQQPACKRQGFQKILQKFATAILRTPIAKDQFECHPFLAFQGSK
jgi:hypothetical protein